MIRNACVIVAAATRCGCPGLGAEGTESDDDAGQGRDRPGDDSVCDAITVIVRLVHADDPRSGGGGGTQLSLLLRACITYTPSPRRSHCVPGNRGPLGATHTTMPRISLV